VEVEVFGGLEGCLKTGVSGTQALEDLVRTDYALGFLIIVFAWIVDVDTEYELDNSIVVIALAQGVLRHPPQERLSVLLRIEPRPQDCGLPFHMREEVGRHGFSLWI